MLHVVRSFWHCLHSVWSPPRCLRGWCCGLFPHTCGERRTALAALAARPGFTPPLTLLKPVHGAEPGLEAHLATFSSRIIPEYEILFCARTANDAGLETARRVAARYPRISREVFVDRRSAGLHQCQGCLDGADGGRGGARHPGDQRQRRAGDAGVSAGGGAAVCGRRAWGRCSACTAAWRRRAACGRGWRQWA